MAIFYMDRPKDAANATEALVAERLNQLDDRWYVLWGFHYADGDSGMREGDFLILGPKGQVLVMEVKGSQSRQFLMTGEWEAEKEFSFCATI